MEDRTKVKNVNGMTKILFDFKPNRCDASVYMNRKIEVTEFVKYIKKLKKDYPNITYFHGMIDILAKCLYSRPKMNQFVQNRTLYMHNNVSLAFVAKEKFEDDSVELLTVIDVKENDTIVEISDFLYNQVKKIRSSEAAGIDDIADFIGKIPNWVRIPIVGVLKWMDKKGILPKSIREGNIYYSSAIVSNLGTFKTGAIYHNLTNFGTASSLITFGEVVEENGKFYMEMGATIDERIADGFYFVKALKLIEYMFAHPEVMMEPASKHVNIPEEDR